MIIKMIPVKEAGLSHSARIGTKRKELFSVDKRMGDNWLQVKSMDWVPELGVLLVDTGANEGSVLAVTGGNIASMLVDEDALAELLTEPEVSEPEKKLVPKAKK